MCFHVWLYRFPDPTRIRRTGVFDDVLSDFRLGLILFFVLSGYLLYRGFARAALRRAAPVDLGLYALRRAARILPAYYLAMLGTLILLWGAGGTPGVRMPASGLIGFGVAWNAGVYLLGGNMLATKALPAYLPYFALGMLLALWVERAIARRGEAPRVGPRTTLALLVGGIGAVVCNGLWHSSAAADALPLLTGALQNLPAGIGFATLLAAVVVGRGPATAWIHARPLALVGLVSYGLYLWHLPLMLFGIRLGLLPHAFVPRLVAVLVPALLAGSASWLLVERVMLARASRVGRRGKRARPLSPRLEARTAP